MAVRAARHLAPNPAHGGLEFALDDRVQVRDVRVAGPLEEVPRVLVSLHQRPDPRLLAVLRAEVQHPVQLDRGRPLAPSAGVGVADDAGQAPLELVGPVQVAHEVARFVRHVLAPIGKRPCRWAEARVCTVVDVRGPWWTPDVGKHRSIY